MARLVIAVHDSVDESTGQELLEAIRNERNQLREMKDDVGSILREEKP
jgi:hypothetical protein